MDTIIKPILLIGESCTDVCLYGDITRLNPEAPTPVMTYNHEHVSLGMSSNVQRNILSLSNANTAVRHICNDNEITKTRFIDEKYGYILLRLDRGSTAPRIAQDVIKKLCEELENGDYSALAISDYDKGFLSYEDIEVLCASASIGKTTSFMDTKKKFHEHLNSCNIVKVNEAEYKENGWERAINEIIVITMGERGARVIPFAGEGSTIATSPQEVVNAAGAGDTFFAALIHKTLLGAKLYDAVRYANIAAGIAVSKSGVVAVNHWEIENE